MGVYDRQIANAKRQIAEKGQSVTWRVQSNGAPVDSSKPWKPSAGTPDDKTVKIVFLPLDLQTRKFLSYLKGTEVPTGSLGGLMGAVDFEPKLKDVVIRDGKELVIRNFDLIAPNGEPILYILEFDA